MRLRLADFKTVGEYNSALHRICTSLRLCGTIITDSQKIEKTLSTFHPSAIQSARNYRQEGFKHYAALIDALQVAGAQDEVLKKNFSAQPLAGAPGREVNANAYKVRKPKMKKRGKKGKKGPNSYNPAKNYQAGKGRRGPRIASAAAPRLTSRGSVRPLNTSWTRIRPRGRARHTLSRWRHHR